MGSGLIAWTSISLIAALIGYVIWQVIADKRRDASKLAQAAELGTRLMLESGPITGWQMQIVWHGIHEVLAVNGSIDTEDLRNLIAKARQLQN